MNFGRRLLVRVHYGSGRKFFRGLCLPQSQTPDLLEISGVRYPCDEWTNVTPKLLSLIGRRLLDNPTHPLGLLKQRIVNHFHREFGKRQSLSPLFSVHEFPNPVVSVRENFDLLLIPESHPSRKKSDSYYVNAGHVLRAHTSAHDQSVIASGRDQFLLVGDVYRRDEVDRSHFPAFHQLEGVRLFSAKELAEEFRTEKVQVFEKVADSSRRADKQEQHTGEASRLMEHNLKATLEHLAQTLFGPEVEYRWTETYFPFTHPSWELEVNVGDLQKETGEEVWMETLGCGIFEHKFLQSAGAGDKIGWAFGLGLERLAMKLYSIPDIRLFWSRDSGFLSQFENVEPETPVTYKPISVYSQCINDLSFWIPENFESGDFFDLARTVCGELLEQIKQIDAFTHPKTGRTSHCYRLIYRHYERTLTKAEVNLVHGKLAEAVQIQLGGEIR